MIKKITILVLSIFYFFPILGYSFLVLGDNYNLAM